MIKIPVNKTVLSNESRKNDLKAHSTNRISSSGPFVKQFEENFSDYVGMKYGVAVSNGTAALHVALLTLGIEKGDEVIVPAFTMGATWLAVLYVGAKPIFVDCEPKTYNIDPNLIEEKITKKTKAIMPVHIYGHPADMDAVLKIAKKHKLFVIEDAAEVHGAEYKGQKCGSMGDINCFSFYANKIITTGEGGMVLTNDKKLAKKARKFMDLYHSDKKRFIHEGVGFNYRMTNLQAALGVGELRNIDKYIKQKEKMSALYAKILKDVPGLRLPETKNYAKNVFWMYAVLVDQNKFGMSRDRLRKELLKRGIDTRDFFYSPQVQPVLKKYLKKNQAFPVTEKISSEGLYLPSGLALTGSQIKTVSYAIRDVQRKAKFS